MPDDPASVVFSKSIAGGLRQAAKQATLRLWVSVGTDRSAGDLQQSVRGYSLLKGHPNPVNLLEARRSGVCCTVAASLRFCTRSH